MRGTSKILLSPYIVFILFVNDLRLAFDFNAALFANDELLLLSNKNLKQLEKS